MHFVLAVVVGGLYAAALYMMMRRSIGKLLIGLVLLGHATNLLLFTAGGLTRGRPPVIVAQLAENTAPMADPLPQAVILTSIVISFGVLAFAVVLVKRVFETVGTDDADEMTTTER